MKTRAVVLSILVAGALSACNEPKQAQQEAAPRPVLVASVHYEPRERAQALPGIVKARIESELAFRVGGRIDRRLVDAGAFVTKGERARHARRERSEAATRGSRGRAGLRALRARSGRGRGEARDHARASGLGGELRISTRSSRPPIRRAARSDKAERAVSLARNALSYATLTADADGVVSAIASRARPGRRGRRAGRAARAHRRARKPPSPIPENLVDRVRVGARRASNSGRCPASTTPARLARTFAQRRSRRPAPTPRASACPTRRAGARLGMSVTVTLSDGAQALARVAARRAVRSGRGPRVWIVDRGERRGRRDARRRRRLRRGLRLCRLAASPKAAKSSRSASTSSTPHEKVRVVQNLAGL